MANAILDATVACTMSTTLQSLPLVLLLLRTRQNHQQNYMDRIAPTHEARAHNPGITSSRSPTAMIEHDERLPLITPWVMGHVEDRNIGGYAVEELLGVAVHASVNHQRGFLSVVYSDSQ